MIVNGWTLLIQDAIADQLRLLLAAYERARRADPKRFQSNANVKLLQALARLMVEVIPADPGRPEFRQGDTLGRENRHWFRAKFLGRFRLFFRYDSRMRVIVYAWVNDVSSLRQHGGRRDPYTMFRAMLASGDPPGDWAELLRRARPIPVEMAPSTAKSSRR